MLFRSKTKYLIGATGLQSSLLAKKSINFPAKLLVETVFCKGQYFSLQGTSPFNHLIYPVPEQAGLGIHSTLDLQGKTKFGPDTEWVEDIDYVVSEKASKKFYKAIQRYWPAVSSSALVPDYAGVRPKAKKQGAFVEDFVVQTPRQLGVLGLSWLTGIESPGITASLALADYTVESLLIN